MFHHYQCCSSLISEEREIGNFENLTTAGNKTEFALVIQFKIECVKFLLKCGGSPKLNLYNQMP